MHSVENFKFIMFPSLFKLTCHKNKKCHHPLTFLNKIMSWYFRDKIIESNKAYSFYNNENILLVQTS